MRVLVFGASGMIGGGVVRECLEDDPGDGDDAYARERIARMLEFFETTSGWYQTMGKLPRKAVARMVKAGGKSARSKTLGAEG